MFKLKENMAAYLLDINFLFFILFFFFYCDYQTRVLCETPITSLPLSCVRGSETGKKFTVRMCFISVVSAVERKKKKSVDIRVTKV